MTKKSNDNLQKNFLQTLLSDSHSSQLTVLMREHSCADAARPHPQRRGRGQLRGHLWVARQVLAQGTLVHVELPAHRARVVGVAALG